MNNREIEVDASVSLGKSGGSLASIEGISGILIEIDESKDTSLEAALHARMARIVKLCDAKSVFAAFREERGVNDSEKGVIGDAVTLKS